MQHLMTSLQASLSAVRASFSTATSRPGQLRNSDTQSALGAQRSAAAPTHLIIMANGLFGQPGNWDVICDQLSQQLDMSQVVLHPSKVNTFFTTYDGIDTCGQRLADEILAVAHQHRSTLTRISVIGHSMGGLLARYAIGALYDPADATIAGLVPCHFLTIATPHMGCDKEGVAQVPFLGWIGATGSGVQSLLHQIAAPTAEILLRRTGRQFFLADTDGGAASLAYANSPAWRRRRGSGDASDSGSGSRRDTQQQPAGTSRPAAAGAPGPSAAAPSSGATGGLRPPASSSTTSSLGDLGRPHSDVGSVQLEPGEGGGIGASERGQPAAAFPQPRPERAPAPATASAVDEPLLVTMTRDEPTRGLFFCSALRSFASRTAYANSDGDHLVGWANSSLRFTADLPQLPPVPGGARGVVLEDPLVAAFDSRCGPQALSTATPSAPPPRSSGGREAGLTPAPAPGMVDGMLVALQSLPWCRIDVSFKGAWIGFAHNNIQATRRLMNFSGIAVTQHLARHFAALDRQFCEMQAAAAAREGQAAPAAPWAPLPVAAAAGGSAVSRESLAALSLGREARQVTRVDAVDEQGQVLQSSELESGAADVDAARVRLEASRSSSR